MKISEADVELLLFVYFVKLVKIRLERQLKQQPNSHGYVYSLTISLSPIQSY